MNHSFGSGDAFTIGVEEELLLVDAETPPARPRGRPACWTESSCPSERAGHEAFLAEIELRSEPRTSAAEAVADIAEGRAAVRAAGGTPMAVGLHPDAAFGDVRLVDSDRYRRVEGEMRGLIKRTPECALHVHVAMPSPDAAVDALMGLREALPLIGALGAGSPFWFGMDSGLASARSAVIRAYPGRGVPPPLRDWEDYLETLDGIRVGGGPEDHTMVWWDARLQPRLGTVELRELDVQTGLEEAAGMAALVHALARRAVEQPVAERPPRRRCTGRASAPCATGSTPSCCSAAGCARRARRRGSCSTSSAARTTRSRAWSGSCARAGRRPGSAPCSPRAGWLACCVTWRTRPRGAIKGCPKASVGPGSGIYPGSRAHTQA